MKKLRNEDLMEISGGLRSSHVAGCVLGAVSGSIGIWGVLAVAGGPLTFGLYVGAIAAGLSLGAGLGECQLMLSSSN
jgi:hypothetical protein